MDYLVWADGTYVAVEDFIEEEWAWMSDDYATVSIPVNEDHLDFYNYINGGIVQIIVRKENLHV